MNKFLIAAAATFFAAASFLATGAEAAGFHLTAPKGVSNVEKAGCHGGGRRIFRRHAIQSVRRAQQKKAYIARQEAIAAKKIAIAKAAAAKKALAAKQAKAAELAQLEAEKTVETASVERENSSIATVDGEVTAAAPEKTEQKVAVAKELGCKKFFPSVGMTLSVPCE